MCTNPRANPALGRIFQNVGLHLLPTTIGPRVWIFQTQRVGFFLALPSLWPLISQQQPNPWFLCLERGAAELHECTVAMRVGFKVSPAPI